MIRTTAAIATAMALVTAAPAQQPRTVQQDFEAATALTEGTDKAAALAAWTALEPRVATKPRSRAVVLARKANVLASLGRPDEALLAARESLRLLPVGDATLAEDRMRSYWILGAVALDTLDYAGAADAFRRAEGEAITPADKIGSLLALVQAQTFVDPAAAAAALARIDAMLPGIKLDKGTAALVERRRAVLLLNTGNIAGARASAVKAVGLLGGLTTMTDTTDVSARSDAAIALLLEGKADEARRYMAFTGAGRLNKGSFDPTSEMQAPDCDGEAGLKPDDVAVVEFTIAGDGTVTRVAPIYAAGGSKVALAFAHAVQDWSWPADKVADIPPFFRVNARVEMRCSTAFKRPAVEDALGDALAAWLIGKGVPLPAATTGAIAAAVPAQRAALTAAEAQSPGSLKALRALYRLADNVTLPREERVGLYQRGLGIARANAAPALAQLAFDLSARRLQVAAKAQSQADYDRPIATLVADPVYAADPQARGAVRLMLSDSLDRKRTPSTAALTLLHQVADDAALRPNDPFRVGALIRIASMEQRQGQIAAARAAFEASGLTASQCAIMDAPPKPISLPNASAFPMEALRWGFEGWTKVQFDIGANGKVENERALLSYPPFIFSDAGTRAFGTMKFAPTYRPDGGPGCGATVNNIRFMLPK